MAKDRNAAAQGIATLLTKLSDPDPDIRFMQLSDLTNILSAPASDYIKSDTHTAARIIEGLLKTLADTHGEVQNQALKWSALSPS
jgi:cullin-associated NEDD8-dissociated protein 1